MVRRQFYINGKPSSDFGIYAASDTYLNAPAVGYDSFSVPKVNGLFISEKDRLSNVTRRFTCFAPDGIKTACEALFQYLYSIDGYFVLQSDYDVSHYCYAYFEEGVEVTPFRAKAGTFDLYFSCMPQKYMATGIGKAVGNNLINPDDLIGHMAYYDIVGDKLCLMFFPGSQQDSNEVPVRVANGGKFTFTAEKVGTWTSVNAYAFLYKTPSGAITGVIYDNPDGLKASMDTSTDVPYALSLRVNSPSETVGFTKMMLVEGDTVLPYEPYPSMPPSDEWVYSIGESDIPIKPSFAITNVQNAINTGALPNRNVWFVHGSGTSAFNAQFNSIEKSVYFANFDTSNAVPAYDCTSMGYVTLSLNANGTIISEVFDGSIFYGTHGDTQADAVFTDISNTDAVGGDAMFLITLSVPASGTLGFSIMVNDSLIYVDLTGLVSAVSYVTMKINSKTYDASYFVATTNPSNDTFKSLNDRTTILGDISLKSQNRIICYTECTVVSSLVQVEWWTV